MAFSLSERMDSTAVVSGNEALIYLILPDGRRKIAGNVIKMDAEAQYSKTEYPVLGYRIKPNKKGPGSIKVKMTLHYNTSVFREAALEFQKTGKDSYYDMQLINEDDNSGLGRQTVLLYGVNWDNMPLFKADAESDYLTEDLTGTANDWDLDNVFTDGGLIDA